jgi:hypothetical protein
MKQKRLKTLEVIGRILIASIVIVGAILLFVGLLKPSENMRVMKINNQRYLLDKKTLANGNCYYIYQSGSKVFVIPCEEKE